MVGLPKPPDVYGDLSLSLSLEALGDINVHEGGLGIGEGGEVVGEVEIGDLLSLYPQADLGKDCEFERVQRIKDTAFSRRVWRRALPDADVLIKTTELSIWDSTQPMSYRITGDYYEQISALVPPCICRISTKPTCCRSCVSNTWPRSHNF